MNTPQCPRCGTPIQEPLAEGAPCPGCVLRSALEHGTPAAIPGRPTLDEVQTALTEFEIEGCLGRGGMGDVYRAQHKRLGRSVAVKVLRPDLELAPEFAERFEREARAMARLQHPNIVTIHDFGESEGLFYLVMEDVEGASLRELMDADLSPREVADFADQALEALAFAHGRGVIHRDIKPENLLVDVDGRLRLVDFGLAKLESEGGAGLSLTGAQGRLGTPHYMAPEQVAASSTVDHRADLYALGVVIYEALTGTLPLGRFRLPSEVDPELSAYEGPVLRLLEGSPDRRFASAEEVRAALRDSVGVAPESRDSAESPKEAQAKTASESVPMGEATAESGGSDPSTGPGVAELLERARKATTEEDHHGTCLDLARDHGDDAMVREALLAHALSSNLAVDLLPVLREAWPDAERVEWTRRLLSAPVPRGVGAFYAYRALRGRLDADPALQSFVGSWISGITPASSASPNGRREGHESLASGGFPSVPNSDNPERDRWILDTLFSARSLEGVQDLRSPITVNERSASALLAVLAASTKYADSGQRIARDTALYGTRGSNRWGTFPRESSEGTASFAKGWGRTLEGREVLRSLSKSKVSMVAAHASLALLELDPKDPEPARAVLAGLTDGGGTEAFDWHTAAVEPFQRSGPEWCRHGRTRSLMMRFAAIDQESWVAELALIPLARHAGDDEDVRALIESWGQRSDDGGKKLGERAAAILGGTPEPPRANSLERIRVGPSIDELLETCASGQDTAARVTALGRIRERVALGFEGASEGTVDRILDLARFDESDEVRREAVTCAAFFPGETERARSTAVQLLERDSAAEVRSHALGVLRWLGNQDPLSREALLRAARRDADPGNRRDALLGIADWARGDRDAQAAIAAQAKDDEDPNCRATALHLLARASNGSSVALKTLLDRLSEDSSSVVRIMAVRELAHGWATDTSVAETLRVRFGNESAAEVRSAICRFLPLGWAEDPGNGPWLRDVLFDDEDPAVREVAIQSLVFRYGEDRALIDWLQRGLANEDCASSHPALLEALVRVAPEQPDLTAHFDRRIDGPKGGNWISLRAELLGYRAETREWLWEQVVGASRRVGAPHPSGIAALTGLYPYDPDVLLELQALETPTPSSTEDSETDPSGGFLEGKPRAWVHALDAILEAWGEHPGVGEALVPFVPYLRSVAKNVALGERLRQDAGELASKLEDAASAARDPEAGTLGSTSTAVLILRAESGVAVSDEQGTSLGSATDAAGRIEALQELERRLRAGEEQTEDILGTLLAVAEVDSSSEVRIASLKTLGNSLGDPRTFEVLESIALHDAEPTVRGEALRTLGRNRRDEATRSLLRAQALHDGSDDVRLQALEALSDPKPGDAEAAAERELLRARVDGDPSFELRSRIVRSIRLGPRLGRDWLKALVTRDAPEGADREAHDKLRRDAFATLCRDRGALDFEWVADRVTSEDDPELCARSARHLLGQWSRDPRALSTVLRVAEDAHSIQVRKAIGNELRHSDRFRDREEVQELLNPTPERTQLAMVRRAILHAEPGGESRAIGMLWANTQMEPRRREQRALCGILSQEPDAHVRRKLIEFFVSQRELITEWSPDHRAMVLDRARHDDDPGIREWLAPLAQEIRAEQAPPSEPRRPARPSKAASRPTRERSRPDPEPRRDPSPRAASSSGFESAHPGSHDHGTPEPPASRVQFSPGAEINRRAWEKPNRPGPSRPSTLGVSISRRPAWTSYWFDWILILVLVLASSLFRVAAESAFPFLAEAPTLPPIGASLLFLQIVVRRHWYHYEIIGHGDPVARISIGIPTREQRSVQLQRAQIDVTRSLGGFLLGYGTLRIWVGEQESAAVWENVANPFALRDQIERLRS